MDVRPRFGWMTVAHSRRRSQVVARRYAVVAGSLGVVLALSACSGKDSDDAAKNTKGKVGIILPESKKVPRWESADRPALEQAFRNQGITATVVNAEGDVKQMQKMADDLLGSGIKVLALVSLETAATKAIQEKAKQKGVTVIDYDRVTPGGSADYFLGYDRAKRGQVQARGLAGCLGAKKTGITYLNGDPDLVTQQTKAAQAVLGKNKNLTKLAEDSVPDSDPVKAAPIFAKQLTAQAGKLGGVVASEDALATVAIAALKAKSLAGKVAVVGAGSSVVGLQQVLSGTQCSTVYESAKGEAGALAELAIALATGKKPTLSGTYEDPSSKRKIPAVLLTPQLVTKTTVGEVVRDGGALSSEVCKGAYLAACKAQKIA